MLRRTLSVTHGLAWQGHAANFLVSLRSKPQTGMLAQVAAAAGPAASPANLEPPGVKAAYLEYLDKQGFTGLNEFLHAFINSLNKRKGKIQGQAAANK